MANRFPLIVDSSSNQIKELEASDNIDLTNSGIVNAQSISATHLNLSGVVTASSFSGNGSGLTGVASTDNIQTATSANFLSNVNIAGITTCQALTVSGNLTVDGTTTTINSTTLTVDDKTIVIASGAADSSAADGAGISIDGASATILYSHSGTKFVSNKPFEATSFSGDGSGLTGVASTDNISTNTVTIPAATETFTPPERAATDKVALLILILVRDEPSPENDAAVTTPVTDRLLEIPMLPPTLISVLIATLTALMLILLGDSIVGVPEAPIKLTCFTPKFFAAIFLNLI